MGAAKTVTTPNFLVMLFTFSDGDDLHLPSHQASFHGRCQKDVPEARKSNKVLTAYAPYWLHCAMCRPGR